MLIYLRVDVVRVVFEGILYEIRVCIEILEFMGFRVESIVFMGGGVKSRVWSRIKVDILGKKVVVEKV